MNKRKAWTWALMASVIALTARSAGASEQQASTAKAPAAGLQTQAKLVINAEDLFPLTRPTRLGLFTVVPPRMTGEVVRVSVPVGELVSKAVRAISDANHRRAERQADQRVRNDLARFLAAADERR
jgi:hypothetical protein